MASQWYFKCNDGVLGPVSIHRLAELADSGRLSPSDLVCGDGMKDWVRADAVDSLKFTEEPAAAVPPSAPRATTARRPQRPRVSPAVWISVAVAGVLLSGILGWAARSWFTSSEPKEAVANDDEKNSDAPASTRRSETPPKGEPKKTDIEPQPRESRPDAEKPLGAEALKDVLVKRITEPNTTDSITTSPGEAEPPPGTPDPDPKVAENPDQPVDKPKPPPIGRQPEPTVLFQQITVAKNSTMSVQGLPIKQQIQYRLLSKLNVGEANEDGVRQVEQVVLDTKLDKCDELSRAILATSLRELIGHQYSYKLDRVHDVFDFQGHKDNKKAAPVDALGSQGFVVTSVMDKDGWIELARISFFRPKEQAQVGEKWQGQMSHDWGPLGSWTGESTYEFAARQQEFDEINYVYKMKYKPPAKDRADLPFKIDSAEFKAIQAGGTIRFDPRQNRVTAAEEKFHVQGVLATNVLGQAASIQLEEQQLIGVRLFDQNPWE